MAWSGECSEYEEGDDGDETGTDIDDLPDEELIVVLRDEQNSIKEAQRLIHKEIKSIRRELKRLLRHYAATHADQQPADHPHFPHQDTSNDSGLGEANYTTDYNTASEVASSHGDSEAGYQAFIEYDADGLAGRPGGDGRYGRQLSGEFYESSTGYEEEELTDSCAPIHKDHEVMRAGPEHYDKLQNGIRTEYRLPSLWSDGKMNPAALDDHTRGRDSTYEDAYNMMRRRHSQTDVPVGNSQTKGDRRKSLMQRKDQSIYSIPETDQNQQALQEDSLPPERLKHMQSSEDELGNLQDFSHYRYNTTNHSRRHSCAGIQTRKVVDQSYGKVDPRMKLKRTRSAQLISVPSDMSATYHGVEIPQENSPALKTTQPLQIPRSGSRNGALYDRPPSGSSDGSDQSSPPHPLDGYGRIPALASGDESGNSARFSDSSYESHPGTDSVGYGQSPQRLSRRSLDNSKHHSSGSTSPRSLQRTRSSKPSLSVRQTNANTVGSRSEYALPRNSHNLSETSQGCTAEDGDWQRRSVPESQPEFPYNNNEAYVNTSADHAATNYSLPTDRERLPLRTRSNTTAKQRQFLRDVRSSTRPPMKAQGLVSHIPL